MRLQAVSDCVIVRQEDREQGIIILPDEKLKQGRILSVGPGKRSSNGTHIAMPFSVGDRIMFGEYAGQIFRIDREEFMVMRENDIFGIIHEE